MLAGALAPYERALHGRGALGLRTVDGSAVPLDVARWLAATDSTDEAVLDRCTGPVLDVGCGPGRFVAALHARGVAALGVDIAETAVAITRNQGLPALLRDVFAAVPGEGRWPSVLLMDGNIGIGGDPARLLARIRTLLAARGRVVVETHGDHAAHAVLEVRFTVDEEPVGPCFAWAHVGRDALLTYAARTGYAVAEEWSSGGRTFLALAA